MHRVKKSQINPFIKNLAITKNCYILATEGKVQLSTQESLICVPVCVYNNYNDVHGKERKLFTCRLKDVTTSEKGDV